MLRPGTPKLGSARLKAHIDATAEQVVDVTPDAWSQHLHNGRDTPLPPADLHVTYTNNRPLSIAGLSAAFFLIRDGHMPVGNITILEAQKIGGRSA